jgi:hypothetical protein
MRWWYFGEWSGWVEVSCWAILSEEKQGEQVTRRTRSMQAVEKVMLLRVIDG